MRLRRRDSHTSLETCTSVLPLILDAKSKFTALKSTKSNDYSQIGNCWSLFRSSYQGLKNNELHLIFSLRIARNLGSYFFIGKT
jgi:hypothetical protein